MAFSMLSRTGIAQALRSTSSNHSKRNSTANKSKTRKPRAGQLGYQPLEERRLLSINPNGAETFVNSAPNSQSGDQDSPAIAVQETTTGVAATNSVVAWESFGADLAGTNGIRFNRYNPNAAGGAALQSNIQPHVFIQGNQENVAVAMRNDGSFVVVWQASGQTDTGTNTSPDADGIYFRRYNSAGTAQGTIETLVNNAATAGPHTNPSISIDNTTGAAGGDFIITWENNTNIMARHFSSAGVALSTEFQVNTGPAFTTGTQQSPIVSVDGDGDFIVVWQSNHAGNQDIVARRFDSAFFPTGLAEFQVASTTAGDQTNPSVSMDTLGNFLVAWTGAPGVDGTEILARYYNSAGVAQGTDFTVNNLLPGNQSRPSVALHDPVGAAVARGFVITWQGPEDPAGTASLGEGIWARGYFAPSVANPQGTPRGNQILIHLTPRSSNQTAPAIGMDSTSSTMIVYQTETFPGNTDTSGLSVWGQRFSRLNSAPVLQGVDATNHLSITISEEQLEIGNSSGTQLQLQAIDPDGDTFTFHAIGSGTPATTIPQNGLLQVNTAIAPTVASGFLIYTPNVDFVGNDRFTFYATDGSLNSNIGYADITVSQVNDPPTFAKTGTIGTANNVNPVQIVNGTSTTPAPHGLSTGHRVLLAGLRVTQNFNSAPVPPAGSTEVRFTTPVAHALATGDKIQVFGIQGSGVFAPGAIPDGTYTVTVINATTLALNGTTYIAGSVYTPNSGRLERVSSANGYRTITVVNPNVFSLTGVTTMGGTAIPDTGTWAQAPLYGLITTTSGINVPITITSAGHGLMNDQIVTISGVTGNDNANGTFRVGSVAANTFNLLDLATGVPIIGSNIYNGGGMWRLVQTGVVSNITNVTPAVVTSFGHSLVNGDRVTITDALIGQAITAISDVGERNASVITSNGHGLQTGQQVTISNVRHGNNVSNARASTPIRITASSNHRLVTGDQVTIVGNSRPEVNGTWTITVAAQPGDNAATMFYLDGSAMTGVDGTGGSWSALAQINGEHYVRVNNANAFILQDLKEVPGSIGGVSQWSIGSAAIGADITVTSNGHDFEDDARGGQVTITGVEVGATLASAVASGTPSGATITWTSAQAHTVPIGNTFQVTLRGLSGSGIFAPGGALNNQTFTATATTATAFTIPTPGGSGAFSGSYTGNSGQWVRPDVTANANGTWLVTGNATNTFVLFDTDWNGPYVTDNALWVGFTQVQLSEGGTGSTFQQPAGFPTPIWTTDSNINGTYSVSAVTANGFTLDTSTAPGVFFLKRDPITGQVLTRWDRSPTEVIPQNQPSFTFNITNIAPGPGNELPFPPALNIISATSNNQSLVPDTGITINYPLGGDVTAGSVTVQPAANQSGTVDITVVISDDGQGTPANDRIEVYTIVINNPPTLDGPLANPAAIVIEDSLENPFTITGITEGANETFQNVTVRAITLNNATGLPDQTLMLDPKITYVQGSTTAVMNLVPVANANGFVRIRVIVQDDSGAGLASDTVTREYVVQIIGIADTPFITDVITNPNTRSGNIVITANGADTQAYRIQNILGGQLFIGAGVVPITEGQWITAAQGTAGLQFVPFAGSITPGSFEALPSVNGVAGQQELGITAGVAPATGHIYIANGVATTVNTTANTNFLATATGRDADGNTVVIFVGQNDAGNQTQMLMRRYNAAGAQLGNPVILDTDANPNFNYDPEIAMDPDGDFVVVWTDPTPLGGGNSADIHARMFNAQGVATSPVFRANTFVTGIQNNPDVSRDSQGNFVVTWVSANQDTGGAFFADTADSTGIFAQRYDFNGVPVSREFRVNQSTAGNQGAPSVSMEPDGDFIIAWESIGAAVSPSDTDAAGYSIHAQRYDAAGNRVALREQQTITLGGTTATFQFLLRLGNKTATVTALQPTAANYAANVAAIQRAMDQLAPGSFVNGDPRTTGNGTTTFIVTFPSGGGLDHGQFAGPPGVDNSAPDYPRMFTTNLGGNGTAAVAFTGAPSQDGPTQNNTVYGGNIFPMSEVQRFTITNAAEGAATTLTAPGQTAQATTWSTNLPLTIQNMQETLRRSLNARPDEVSVTEHLGPITAINTGVTPIQFQSGAHGLVNGDRITLQGIRIGGVNIGQTNNVVGQPVRVNATGHGLTAGQTIAVSGVVDSKPITGATNANPIVITSTGHGLVNGDTVTIAGVGGNTAANGTWTVADVTANTFTLVNPATGLKAIGNANYTSGGTWSATSKANGTYTVQTTLTAANGTITGNNTANPVQVTTGAPHGLVTGMSVVINIPVGPSNPNAAAMNGTKVITVTGPNTFTLTGVNGTGFLQNTGTWTAVTTANANVFELVGATGRGGPTITNTGRFDRDSALNNNNDANNPHQDTFFTIAVVDANTFTLIDHLSQPVNTLDGTWEVNSGTYRLIQSSTGQSKFAFDVGFSGRYGTMGDIPNIGITVTGATVAVTTPRTGTMSEFLVNNNTGGDQRHPSVAVDPEGNFLVAFQENAQVGGNSDIHARLFNSAGVVTQTTPLNGNRNQFAVQPTSPAALSTGEQTAPKVMVTPDGETFLVTWNHQPDIAQIPARLFGRPISGYDVGNAANNGRLGNAFEIIPTDSSNPLPGTQQWPYSVAMDDNGNIQATIIVSAGGVSSVVTRSVPLDLPDTVTSSTVAGLGTSAGIPVTINSPNHGLQTGDQIIFTGSRRGSLITNVSGLGVGPIQITSQQPHNLTTGDVVQISGVQGNTAANGNKTITVTGPNTFTLDGSLGNGDFVPGNLLSIWQRNPALFPSNLNGRFNVTRIDANNFSFSPTVNLGPYIGGGYTTAISDVVTDATNNTPIAITAQNHGLQVGDYVTITGVNGNPAANGTFQVAPVGGAVGNVTGPNVSPMIVTSNDHRLVVGQQITISGVQVGLPITGATNASPIVITSNGHGLTTGDTVVVSDVDGNSAANGTWVVTVVNANSFSLNGSTGNGNYTPNTGKWVKPAATTNANGTFFVGPAAAPIGSFGAAGPNITINAAGHGLVNGEFVTVTGAQVGSAITATSAANPTIITSAANHNLTDGTQVTISGVQVGAVISAATGNGVSPILVTSNGHGLATGNTVTITGAAGNTAMNGNWTVTQVNANQFSLNGSTGNGTYTANSGTWTTTSRVAPQNGVRFVQFISANTFALFTDPALQNGVNANNGPYVLTNAVWTRPTVTANANGTFPVQASTANNFQLGGAVFNGPYLNNTASFTVGRQGTITGAAGTPLVITSLAHGLTNGAQVLISGVGGNTAANGTRWVGNVTTDTFTLFTDATLTVPVSSNGAYTGGGTWVQQDLSEDSFALYTDAALTVPVVGNANYAPGTGTWTAHTLSPNVFALAGTSGTGQYTSGGRFTVPFEEAAPTIETVYQAADLTPPLVPTFRVDTQPILAGERLPKGLKKLVVTFSENMSTAGGSTGVNSVTNKANWQILRNAAVGEEPSLDVAPGLLTDITFGYNSLTGRYEAILTFAQGLPQGDYILRALPAIQDANGNALDGDRDGQPGGNFELRFSSTGDATSGADELIHPDFTFNDQTNSQVARDANGNYVVVWQSNTEDGNGAGIYGARYLADGTPLGAQEVQTLQFSDPLNLPNNGSFFTIDIPGDANPPATINYSTTAAVTRDRIRAALTTFSVPITVVANSATLFTITFAAPGLGIDRPQITAAPVAPGTFPITMNTVTQGGTGFKFRVNVTTLGEQTNPALSMAADGRFAVAWESDDLSGTGIFARSFTAAGVGNAQVAVNATTLNPQTDPAIDMADDGTFVVVWRSDLIDGSEGGIRYRKFNATGGTVTGEVAVNNLTFGDQSNPDVAVGKDGVAMVVWEAPDFKGNITGVTSDGNPSVITSTNHGLVTGQTVIISGVAGVDNVNGTWPVTVINANSFSIPSIGIANPGYQAGTGQFEIPTAGKGVFQRRFTTAGVAIGNQARVNFAGTDVATIGQGDQTNGIVEADPYGRYIVTFNQTDGDGLGIFAQAYRPDANDSPGGLKVGTLNETQRLTFVPPAPADTRQITLAVGGVTTPPITYSANNAALTATRIREGLEAIGLSVQVTPVAPLDTTTFDITFLNEGLDVAQLTATAVGGGFALSVVTIQNGGVGGGYEFMLNTTTTGDQTRQQLAMDADGDFVVAFESGGDIIARRFNILGGALGSEFTVNATVAGNQTLPSVAMDADGDLLFAWSSPNPNPPNDLDVYIRKYVANLTPPVLPLAEANGPYNVDEGNTNTVQLSSAGSATGVGINYLWDLDNDGNFGEVTVTPFGDERAQNPLFTPFNLDGTAAGLSYIVRLQVEDSIIGAFSAVDTATVIVANVNPTATSIGGPYSFAEGSTTNTLTGVASDPFPGEALLYDWDLNNDGTFELMGVANPNFSAAGLDGPTSVTIGMRVRDDDGGTSGTVTGTVNITNVAPTANAGGPYNVVAGSSIPLAGSATDPGDAQAELVFEWDLDDNGSFETIGQNPTYTATGPLGTTGAHTVRLQVSDGDPGGTSAIVTATVNVTSGLAANSGGPYTVVEGQSVVLDRASGSPPNATFSWDFNGNGTFGEPSTVHGSEQGLTPTFFAGPSLFGQSVNVVFRASDGVNNVDSPTVVNVIAATTPLIIDDHDAPSGTGSVTFSSNTWATGQNTGLGRNDNIHLEYGETFLPSEVATYTFNLPSTGRYRVSATWVANPDFWSQNTRFEVSDASTVLGTTVLNQSQNPDDFTDPSDPHDPDSIWENVGDFDIFSGSTLTVKIFSSQDNKYAIADAIRIQKIADLSPQAEINVVMNGTGAGSSGATITDNTGTADFGTTFFGRPVTKTFTISNQGTLPLNLTAPTATGTAFQVTSLPASTVAPGSSTSFTVEMSGNVTGPQVGSITFGTNDSNENPFNFTLSGTVRTINIIDDGDPGFVSSPAPAQPGGWGQVGGSGREFDYQYNTDNPNVAGPEFATWTFNVTPGLYRVSTTWAFGFNQFEDSAPFTIFDGSVAGGVVVGGRNINQQVDPGTTTDYPTGFEFPLGTASNQNWERVDIVNITGTTLTVQLLAEDAQKLALADSILIDRLGNVPAGPELVVVENQRNAAGGTLSFGQRELGQFIDKTFTIRNTGNSTLNITSPVTIGGTNNLAFSVVTQPSDTQLDQGEVTTFVVRMKAEYEGVKNATINFTTNDGDEGSVAMPITGTVDQFHYIDDAPTNNAEFNVVNAASAVYVTGIGYRNDTTVASPSTSVGDVTASWTFSNIAPGFYAIAMTWFDTSSNPTAFSSNTPVTVLDGAQTEFNGTINQRTQSNDFFIDGAGWRFISSFFQVDSNGTLPTTVTVTMTNLNTDGAVIADGILLIRTGGGVPPGNSESGDSGAGSFTVPSGNTSLRPEETDNAVDAALLNTAFWSEDMDDVAGELAADGDRTGSYDDPIATGLGGNEQDELEAALADWLE